MSAEYKLSLPFQSLETADPNAKAVLEKAKAQLGFIPNMYAGMANASGLLDTYLVGYARFRKDSGFTPAEQEVVFLTISRANGCDYCVAAHSLIADQMSKVPLPVTDAIRDGRPIPDPKLAALSTFTDTMLRTRGLPANADVEAFLAVGYSERQVLEIILAIAVKTLSNYANHLLHTPLDAMFASRVWQRAA
ncbi:carboxymuconolactone decarboxylase family protein [Ferrovibrio xuzhouensis]|uniref:Carboxymuconolactone decarboxylase family protein n=1 Tax=Ferrovibrio xuzhouensis TaxID=1576914 RepID=A0ABV7VI10_9PROT